MEKISFFSQASTDSFGYLPRICRSNLALPASIMLEDCRYCRRQLAHAAGRPELLARHLEHMLNNDCLGGDAMREASLAKVPQSSEAIVEHTQRQEAHVAKFKW